MKFLITGGAGYIGSITNWLLLSKGHETVIFDNMSNGHTDAVGDTKLIVGDLRNRDDINRAMQSDTFDAVIHFAALDRLKFPRVGDESVIRVPAPSVIL